MKYFNEKEVSELLKQQRVICSDIARTSVRSNFIGKAILDAPGPLIINHKNFIHEADKDNLPEGRVITFDKGKMILGRLAYGSSGYYLWGDDSIWTVTHYILLSDLRKLFEE